MVPGLLHPCVESPPTFETVWIVFEFATKTSYLKTWRFLGSVPSWNATCPFQPSIWRMCDQNSSNAEGLLCPNIEILNCRVQPSVEPFFKIKLESSPKFGNVFEIGLHGSPKFWNIFPNIEILNCKVQPSMEPFFKIKLESSPKFENLFLKLDCRVHPSSGTYFRFKMQG